MKVFRGFTRSTSHVRFSGTATKQLAIFARSHVTNDARVRESLNSEGPEGLFDYRIRIRIHNESEPTVIPTDTVTLDRHA